MSGPPGFHTLFRRTAGESCDRYWEKGTISFPKKAVLVSNRVRMVDVARTSLEGLTPRTCTDVPLTCGVFTVPVHPFL